MAESTKVLTTHVPMNLAERVEAVAQRLDRSRGWIVKQALEAWVTEEEERYRLTLEAMAQIDAGLGIDHARMVEWAASLDTDNPLPVPGR